MNSNLKLQCETILKTANQLISELEAQESLRLRILNNSNEFLTAGIRGASDKLESVRFIKNLTGLGLRPSYNIVSAVMDGGKTYSEAYAEFSQEY